MWIMPRMVGWRAADLALVLLMWAVMMAAMMLPSALPVILLVAKVSAGIKARHSGVGLTGAFVTGYLLTCGNVNLRSALSWRLQPVRGAP